jgi:glutamate formiminotransferase
LVFKLDKLVSFLTRVCTDLLGRLLIDVSIELGDFLRTGIFNIYKEINLYLKYGTNMRFNNNR